MPQTGDLLGTFTDDDGAVTDLSGSVTLSGASGNVAITGTIVATPRVALWSVLYGATAGLVTIAQPVLLDMDATCAGAEIVDGGNLIFDPDASRLLKCDARPCCVMGGTLTMRPASAAIRHELRFINVDETLMTVGGGMEHAKNPGLCVEDGVLDLQGAVKTAWTYAAGALTAGQTSVDVVDATGWQVGDTIVIAPTELTSVANHWTHSDRRTISAIAGNTVTVTALTYAHPLTTSPTAVAIAAEVLNLSRNVVISGDTVGGTLGAIRTQGRAQIMIMGSVPIVQTISYVEGVHLGPRQGANLVLGRYGLHFHLMGDAAAGTVVEGVVLHDLGSRGFVAHGSHGITYRDCVAWSYFDAGYWWDMTNNTTDPSNDIRYDHCVAGAARYDPAKEIDGVRTTGFALASGLRVAIHRCSSFAHAGWSTASGYLWPESAQSPKTWEFEDNDVHNVQANGVYVWQNGLGGHQVVNLRAWKCGIKGVYHGAYVNDYHYENLEAWLNKQSDFHLSAHHIGVTNGTVTKLIIGEHVAAATTPTVFRDVAVGTLEINEPAGSKTSQVDVIDCGVIPPGDVVITRIAPGSVVRVQEGAQAWQITSTGTVGIPVFA